MESKVPVSLCCHCSISVKEILPVFGIFAFLWGVPTGGVIFSDLYFEQNSVRKKDYAKMEMSFLSAITSIIGEIFDSETPNLSIYIWRIVFS